MIDNIKLGEINTLQILRDSPHGFFLSTNEDEEAILLPKKFCPDDAQIGDELEVFVYTDSEDRLIATTIYPKAFVNEFIYAQVVSIENFGAFVDIGLDKDLLVPKNRQKRAFRLDEFRIIRIVIDEKSERLIGVEKITSFLHNQDCILEQNDEVSILVFAKTPLGFKCIINNSFEGMIFHNEIFQDIQIGTKTKAFIKFISPDKKIDLSLREVGQKAGIKDCEQILNILKEHDGKMNFSYKSSPENIKNTFSLSKKAFKKTLTTLLEQNKICLDENKLSLKNKED